MKLIIAEKPSLARNIAAAIGNAKRANGYIVCDGYIVTWAFGHLFSLCDIEDYTGKETVPLYTFNVPWGLEALARYRLWPLAPVRSPPLTLTKALLLLSRPI